LCTSRTPRGNRGRASGAIGGVAVSFTGAFSLGKRSFETPGGDFKPFSGVFRSHRMSFKAGKEKAIAGGTGTMGYPAGFVRFIPP
jgi:hypothetical protein